MFGWVLLCCWSLSLLRLSSSLVHGNIELDEGPVSGRHTDTAYLSDLERSHATLSVQDPALLPVDSVEDHFLMDTGSYDEVQYPDLFFKPVACLSSPVSVLQDSSATLQLQGRAMRSSRRCIPHKQSCLGYPLPCCDPCDTCYCRFFNAICYCRRVGHTCPPRRT
ncbi:agouti-related protein isoform X1 [Leuresthes tenuis]|uniref:agouti-related protein isoform X1 n=1 Tax=Leuresthes tenuis TaxID=355514 RepID=UPI003B508DCA